MRHARIGQFLIGLSVALALSNCGAPSPPQCRSVPKASRGDATELVADAREAWLQLEKTGSTAQRERYNQALAKLVDQLRCGSRNVHEKAAAMGTRIDTSHTLGTGLTLEDLEALFPASSVDLDKIGDRHLSPGLGIPMVGWDTEERDAERRYPFAPPTGVPLILTTVLDFDQSVPTWRFLYPGRVPEIEVGNRSERLAMDWSAAAGFYWKMSDLDDLDIEKVFLPTSFVDETVLYAATPYDPEKIPVIFVHGLKSSPGAFKTMFNDLLGKEWFRENYQAWFFSYPTGTSWVYNAAKFRDEMRKATVFAAKRGSLKRWNDMVLVSHSMGGVISHASLVEPGTKFYDGFFDRPIEELKVSDEARSAIRWVTLYDPLEEPSRVIYMAAPHQGSPLADRIWSQMASNLIRLPKRMTIDLVDVAFSDLGTALRDGGDGRLFQSSIGTLSPTFRGYHLMKDLPYREGLKMHSIIGDRGRGDSPESSDGVVPYWSSHIEGVDSELIVPSNHSVCARPETIAEVERILQLHLEE